MKLSKGLLCLSILLVLAFSCVNDKVDVGSYVHERDSLIQANQDKTRELDELNEILTTIATGLDSIAAQEHVLFSNNGSDGVMLNRQQIAENLKNMADILARQRKTIQILQDSLSNMDLSQGMERLRKVVTFLNYQLEDKDRVIQSLQADLNNSKKDINQLRSSLSAMQARVDVAERKTQVLTKAVSTQDEIINECYVKIGTKKQLMESGLLKGGFLKKKKVNYEDVEKSKFNAVDIRKFREVTLHSSNPTILTPQPSNRSFHFEDNGDGTCTLVITNPTVFWSVSNFLIIQL